MLKVKEVSKTKVVRKSRKHRKPKYLRDRDHRRQHERQVAKLVRLVNRLLYVLGVKLVFGVSGIRVSEGDCDMSVKVMNLTTTVMVVPVSVSPKEYRIDFTGAAAVESVRIPYSDTVAPVKVDFPVEGNYSATAGLYDSADVLLGSAHNADFVVGPSGETKEINVVADFVVTDEVVVTASRRR